MIIYNFTTNLNRIRIQQNDTMQWWIQLVQLKNNFQHSRAFNKREAIGERKTNWKQNKMDRQIQLCTVQQGKKSNEARSKLI